MLKKYKKIKVDDIELNILINCLNEMRNKIIREDGDITFINELLLKYIYILEN